MEGRHIYLHRARQDLLVRRKRRDGKSSWHPRLAGDTYRLVAKNESLLPPAPREGLELDRPRGLGFLTQPSLWYSRFRVQPCRDSAFLQLANLLGETGRSFLTWGSK